jgi:hypothetical protein
MVQTLLRYCAPVAALGIVAGCTIVTTSDKPDVDGGNGGQGAAGTGGVGAADGGNVKVPNKDAGAQDGKAASAGNAGSAGKAGADGSAPDSSHVPSHSGGLCDPTAAHFSYTGTADYDGQPATLTFDFSGSSVTGSLHKDGVCDGNGIRLQRVDISFNAALYSGTTWESTSVLMQGPWTGGDYDCDGKLMDGYPTAGDIYVWQEGSWVWACRRIDADGNCLYGYYFPAINKVYDTTCSNDAGPPTPLPVGCYNRGTAACNPLTNGGCASDTACDYGQDTAGGMALGCYGGDNSGATGSACNNTSGPWCTATHHCGGSPETCAKFCCANSDCPNGGQCTPFDSAGTGTLGTCTGGASGGGVVTLASGQDKPDSIAVDGANVYWANVADGYSGTHGAIMKVPIGGGTPVALASGQSDPSDLATDGVNVYWTNQSANTIMSVSVSGGTPTTLASDQAGPAGIAVRDDFVYWCSQYGGIRKVGVNGGTPSVVAASNCGYHIAVGGGFVYWVNSSGNTGYVMSVSVNADPHSDASAPPAVVATASFYPWSVAVDNISVYWTNLQPHTGSVLAAALSSGTMTSLASDQAYPWDVVVDGSGVYWANGGSGTGADTIMKTGLAGGTITTLASDQSNPTHLAVDGVSVYWTNTGDGTVRKVAK